MSSTAERHEHAAFIRVLVERYLIVRGGDPAAASLVEHGLLTGRLNEQKPPVEHQQPERFYPGLTSLPWHNPLQFGWVAAIEAAYPAIRRELVGLFEAGSFTPMGLSGELAETGSWQEFRLYTDGAPSAANLRRAPATAEALLHVPGVTTAGLVYAAAITGGTHIRPHWGPHNARLRCHLGLVVPPGCSLRVGTETRTWDEGRLLIFDDSYEHELWHRGDGTRIVLIFDIWHPDLTDDEIAAVTYSSLPFLRDAYDVARHWVSTGEIPHLETAFALRAHSG